MYISKAMISNIFLNFLKNEILFKKIHSKTGERFLSFALGMTLISKECNLIKKKRVKICNSDSRVQIFLLFL